MHMGHLNFCLAVTAILVMFTFGGHFVQKNAAQAHIFVTSNGKRRFCLLKVMVQFGSLSPDKILQAGDLT